MHRTVYVDKRVEQLKRVESMIRMLKADMVRVVNSMDEIIQASPHPFSDISSWKNCIFLTWKQGNFIKPFYHHSSLKLPKKKTYIISHMEGCLHDCAYCFLQGYQNPPLLKIFMNPQDMLPEIDALLEGERDAAGCFFAAGILSDSFHLDSITGLSSLLFPHFRKNGGPILEMRTKTGRIPNLSPGEGKRDPVILSWTVSSPGVHKIMEQGTASPEQRISAAAFAQKLGYRVAFHLDPIFIYPGWEEEYRALITSMGEVLEGDMVHRMTLGCVRFTEALRSILRKRFPGNSLFLGEFVRCEDGKFRYFQPIRVNLYNQISAWIEETFPGVAVQLNMETPGVWERWRYRP